ncbi:MAG: signal peptide peptidase SppA [Candidatus Diapherotrites archaeon]|nr:signal peptide peptidase SppA [Candidatus Diapherotrites archaeon]
MRLKDIFFVLFLFIVFLIGFAILASVFFFGDYPSQDTIAVIPIRGIILSGGEDSLFSNNIAKADDIVENLELAASDPTVKAILLDIDSGGGSVVGSRRIVKKIELIKKDFNKPVFAYINETGASGAYYVASAADFIIADEGSLVGSIGAIIMIPDINEFLSKVGVKMNIISSGDMKDIGSIYRPMKKEERKLFEDITVEIHEMFKDDVLRYREGKINKERFNEISDGRIFLGKQALLYGLIDATGSYEEALSIMKNKLGIKGKLKIKKYYKERSIIEKIFSENAYALSQVIKYNIIDSLNASNNLSDHLYYSNNSPINYYNYEAYYIK